MLARIHKAMRDKDDDQGFTLIELLVVMIIIGILAAIAIPVFLSQRAKARDTATKSDVSTVGKEIAAYYVDGTDKLAGVITPATPTASAILTINTTTAPVAVVATVKLSDGSTAPTAGAIINISIPTPNTNNCSAANSWYAQLTNPNGSTKTYVYSAQGGLGTAVPTACA
jgi:type IV pilus assembly protein PilA